MSDVTEDLEGHSWPGFVDILSAAIMMFVFFVLITAVALFFHVMTFTSKQEGSLEQLDHAAQKLSELELERDELKRTVAGLNEKMVEAEATFSEQHDEQRITISDDGLTMVVFFGANSITITQSTTEKIREFTDQVITRHGAGNVELSLTSPKTTSGIETIARKIAMARIFNVRNTFLNTEVRKEATYLKVMPPEAIEDEHDWAKIQFSVAR